MIHAKPYEAYTASSLYVDIRLLNRQKAIISMESTFNISPNARLNIEQLMDICPLYHAPDSPNSIRPYLTIQQPARREGPIGPQKIGAQSDAALNPFIPRSTNLNVML